MLLLDISEPLEDPRVEADSEVLGRDAKAPKAFDEMGKRGEDQVERAKPCRRGRLARNLTDDERAAHPQSLHRPVGEDVQVLEVDDVRAEVVHLGQEDLLGFGLGPEPVLGRPGALQRIAVDDDLVCRVAKLREVVRIGVPCPERRGHERLPLLGIRPPVEPGTRGVVRGKERRIARVDDQKAHRT